MKICIVLPSLLGGGAERMHILMADEWIKNGNTVDFIILDDSNERGALKSILPKNSNSKILGVQKLRKSLFPLKRLFKENSFQIILVPMWPLTVIAILAKLLALSNSKIVISDHTHLSTSRVPELGVPLTILRLTIGIFYRFSDAIVCVSKGVAQDIAKLGKLNWKNISVIYNPICDSVPHDNSSIANANLWREGAKFKLLAVGSLKEQKNFSNLIFAYSKLNDDIKKNSHLIILGEGPLRKNLENLISALNLSKNISLPGFMIDPNPWFKSSDLFILSSSWEGFGNVIVEALYHKTPVVSTDCNSGPREILENGRFGELVEPNNPDELSKAIEFSLSSEHDLDSLYNRSQDFTIIKASQDYIDLFRSLKN